MNIEFKVYISAHYPFVLWSMPVQDKGPSVFQQAENKQGKVNKPVCNKSPSSTPPTVNTNSHAHQNKSLQGF